MKDNINDNLNIILDGIKDMCKEKNIKFRIVDDWNDHIKIIEFKQIGRKDDLKLCYAINKLNLKYGTDEYTIYKIKQKIHECFDTPNSQVLL